MQKIDEFIRERTQKRNVDTKNQDYAINQENLSNSKGDFAHITDAQMSEINKKRNLDNYPQNGESSKSSDSHGNEFSNKQESQNGGSVLWSRNFKSREAVQPVRNCTQLDRSVREDLIFTVATMLLGKKHMIKVSFMLYLLLYDTEYWAVKEDNVQRIN